MLRAFATQPAFQTGNLGQLTAIESPQPVSCRLSANGNPGGLKVGDMAEFQQHARSHRGSHGCHVELRQSGQQPPGREGVNDDHPGRRYVPQHLPDLTERLALQRRKLEHHEIRLFRLAPTPEVLEIRMRADDAQPGQLAFPVLKLPGQGFAVHQQFQRCLDISVV